MERHTRLVLLLALLVLFGISIGGYFATRNPYQAPIVRIAFLDVGQGDAIIIETPTGNQILIDGGVDGSVLSQLGTVLRPGDRHIDMVIATHPDADHIGGLIDVINRYSVDTFIESGATASTATFSALATAVDVQVPTVVTARMGDRIISPDGVVLDILGPYRTYDGNDTNAQSLVVRLQYGALSVMLTGDAPQSVERDLVRWYGTQLESEIVKAGHHGSRTSTDPDFITALDPLIGIISAGKNNRYGHPHQEVLSVFEQNAIPLITTYDKGTIIFESDGVTLWRI